MSARSRAEILADALEHFEIREELFPGRWALMWGMRNRIAHGYLLVDGAVVAATLRNDIPVIGDRIRSALGNTGGV